MNHDITTHDATDTKPEPTKPKVGDHVNVRGVPCEIFKVRAFGTVDVVSLDGKRAWRVSGLW